MYTQEFKPTLQEKIFIEKQVDRYRKKFEKIQASSPDTAKNRHEYTMLESWIDFRKELNKCYEDSLERKPLS